MQGQVLVARVTRNGWVESVHAGHAVIVDPDGAVVRSWGRPEDLILPRSSNKPLQAAGMVEAGVDLTGPHLAIAAASHSGEAFHLAAVRQMLADGALTEEDLGNTPALPYGHAAQLEWIRGGGQPSALTQNCSGKHAAMLRTALALGVHTAGYLAPEHVVQVAATGGIQRLSGEAAATTGVDGCGAPVVAVSLVGLARAFSRTVQASAGTGAGRVARAMSAHPQYVGGTGRDVTVFMQGLPGSIAKDGAEAVHAFALPDGHAAALKVADGSERARASIAGALMRHLGLEEELIAACASAPILGGGRPVGTVETLI